MRAFLAVTIALIVRTLVVQALVLLRAEEGCIIRYEVNSAKIRANNQLVINLAAAIVRKTRTQALKVRQAAPTISTLPKLTYDFFSVGCKPPLRPF